MYMDLFVMYQDSFADGSVSRNEILNSKLKYIWNHYEQYPKY